MEINYMDARPREDQGDHLDEGWWSSVLEDEASLEQEQLTTAAVLNEGDAFPITSWKKVQELFDHDEIVELEVSGCNRGGLLVQGDDLHGFVPVSHLVDVPVNPIDEERRQFLAGYIGRKLMLKVIECEPSEDRIVLSERAALAGQGRRKQLLRSLKIGETVSGTVTNVTEFGVFVDLGGVEGLIHVSELSWGRVQHPADVVSTGQQVNTLVLQVNEENSRVALSIKRLHPNPWEVLISQNKPGDILPATITTIMHFGAFARLDVGVEGLIHISSFTLQPDQKRPEEIVQSGQQVMVRILHIDAARRRLGLSLVTNE